MKNKQYRALFPDAPIYSETYCARLKFTNAHRDPSYKKKISENTKRFYRNSDWVKKHNKALKKGQNTSEAKANHRKGAFIYFENRTKRQIEFHKKNIVNSWKDPLKRENRVIALKKAHNRPEVRRNHSRATKEFIESLTL